MLWACSAPFWSMLNSKDTSSFAVCNQAVPCQAFRHTVISAVMPSVHSPWALLIAVCPVPTHSSSPMDTQLLCEASTNCFWKISPSYHSSYLLWVGGDTAVPEETGKGGGNRFWISNGSYQRFEARKWHHQMRTLEKNNSDGNVWGEVKKEKWHWSTYPNYTEIELFMFLFCCFLDLVEFLGAMTVFVCT